jgi:hypothetical protein
MGALNLVNSNQDAASIEVLEVGGAFDFFAGSLRYEAQAKGVRAGLWALDLLITFPMIRVRRPFESKTLVGGPSVIDPYRVPRWAIAEEWPAWTGEVVQRSELADEFGHPETFGPELISSSDLFRWR